MMKLYLFRAFKCISSEKIRQKMTEIKIKLITTFCPLMSFRRFFDNTVGLMTLIDHALMDN